MARKKQKSKGKKVVPITAKARTKGTRQKSKREAAAAPAAGARRLRFRLPGGAGGGMEKARQGLSRTWRELAIRLRLSRAGKAAPPVEGNRASLQRGKGRQARPAVGRGIPAARRTAAGRRASTLAGYWQAFGERCPRLQALLRQAATVDGLVAILLAVLLFYPPYFRGLFFARELLPTHIFTAMLFALLAFYKIYRREPLFSRHPLDWAIVALLALYTTSSIAAWNARDAVGAILKMANYAAVYWMLAYGVRSLSAVRNYLAVFFTSGTGVAVLGLGAAFGTFRYKDAFVGGRIYSSLQYPNTLAAFLTAINLFGLYLWAEARHLASKLLLSVGNYLLFLTFLGTQSRGALLIYPLGLLVLLLGLTGGVQEPGAKQKAADVGCRVPGAAPRGLPGRSGAAWRGAARVLGHFALQLVSALAVFGKVMAAANSHSQLAGWLWVLAGAAVAALLQLLWHYAENGIRLPAGEGGPAVQRTLKPWVLPAAGLVLALAIAAGGFALARQAAAPAATGSGAVWKSWVQRLESISLKDENAQDRLNWSRDALRIMASSPLNAILGAGGGGWNALYHRYQDYLYFSTEVHNHFMQVGVETGIPGLLAFIAIWIFFFAGSVRTWRAAGDRSQQALRGTAWAIFSGALALGLHSLIDFNLSLGAVAILLWGLFGLERGLERISTFEERDASGKVVRHPGARLSPGVQGAIVGVLAGAFFFLSLALALGDNYAQAAAAALKNQDARAAVENLDRAIRYDPWTTSYRTQLAQILLYQGTQQQDGAAIRKAQETLRAAVQKSRGDFQLRLLYARALFNGGQVREGVGQLEEAVTLMPLKQEVYDNLAVGYLEAGRFLLEQAGQNRQAAGGQGGNVEELRAQGRSYLEKALQVPGRIEARMAAVPKEHLKLWRRAPLLAVSPSVKLKAGEAAVLLGKWPQAETYLAAAAQDPMLKPEALLWHGLALNRQGKDGEKLIGEALKLNQDLAKERERIEKILPGRPAAGTAGKAASNLSASRQ
ncbi:MAG TPA: hypothetical protein GXX19_09695 [Syntrophomonadaceae bacterium]|nr:hypothetical protein [Syntrophomonadaceae bacterium]